MNTLFFEPVIYMARQVYLSVWSGLTNPDEIDDGIEFLLQPEPEHLVPWLETALRILFYVEFCRKQLAEADWPAVTHCDRLDNAFTALLHRRILSIYDAKNSIRSGAKASLRAVEAQIHSSYVGYCFYDQGDIYKSIHSGGLDISLRSTSVGSSTLENVGRIVVDELAVAGLDPVWSGNPDDRIHLKGFVWQRRMPDLSIIAPPYMIMP